MNQKFYVDQTLQKNIHLKINTLEYNIICFFFGEDRWRRTSKNFSLWNYKHETVLIIQDVVRKFQEYFITTPFTRT